MFSWKIIMGTVHRANKSGKLQQKCGNFQHTQPQQCSGWNGVVLYSEGV